MANSSGTLKSSNDATTPDETGPGVGLGKIGVLPASFYASFLSQAAKARKPSPIRGLFPLEQTPGMISLLAGKPNAALFPLTGVQFTAPRVDDSGAEEAVHALVNPGDPVLIEKPVYAGVIPMFETLLCEMIEVETDADGPDSQSLRNILDSWPSTKPKPKILYTIPYGCNPTGATTSLARRQEVLDISRKHNILILEDDPYYFMYFGTRPRIPSYFTLEAQTGDRSVGRVLRFDSFSKIISAGIRIGFVTGPTPLLDAIDKHTATANLQASSFSQAVVVTLLRAWGRDGFLAHVRRVADFYRAKRDVFEAAMGRHLHGLAEWKTPEAGMFFW
ncbi:PLP-dependent transferase [Lactarius psammicola]|nr:PLP-dependent transferase [Lactarius psammicola]